MSKLKHNEISRELAKRNAKRFAEAPIIQMASNPAGVALALHAACKECIAEGVPQQSDPAVRLIAHQLAYLLDTLSIQNNPTLYAELIRQCENAAKNRREKVDG